MGAETAAACATCGERTPEGARFCPSCGARLAEHAALTAEEGGEYRQITVLFCDLVGSTGLSARLDPEDLRELLRDYQSVCAEAIERRGGMIAQFLGDGLMAYFGYPLAYEDAAPRAADAALEIVERIAATGSVLKAERGIDFATRLAMHTGRVLVGQMGAGRTREPHALTGMVPNLASRLERHAPANGIVLSDTTRGFIAATHAVEPIGRVNLRGVPEPVEIHRLVGRAAVLGMLPPLQAPLVGRERELAALRDAWARVGRGESLRVLVTAEPGAGKSVLASAFMAETGIGRKAVLELAGSAATRHAPFATMADALARWLEAPGEGTPRERLATWLGAGPHSAGDAELLLRLSRGDVETDREGREAMFAAGTALLGALAAPLLLVVDDAHWVDASTLELVDRFFAARRVPCLLLVLTRPGLEMMWSDGEELSLTLGGLDEAACATLIASVAGAPVEAVLARRILETTNGLPLHVEELTRALVASDRVREERGVIRAVDLTLDAPTPDSLFDVVMTRLDPLGRAKQIAQIAAVLGRSFELAALAEVSGSPPAEVEAAVSSLVAAGILTTARGQRLAFRHALYQAAAYESLVRRARRVWHERYLGWLERDPDRLARTRPETVGFHLARCGRLREAAERYLEAGLAANRSQASLEASAHFGTSAKLLAGFPAEGRNKAEIATLRLRVQVLLAGALLSARSPGAPITRAAYETAVELAETAPESEWHFPAWWGWWRVSDSFATMARRAERLLAVSEHMQGREFKLQAMHCVWANSFQMGELARSIANAREGLALYEAGAAEGPGTLYGGHDAKVCALGEIALAEWLRGAGDAAVRHADGAIEHATRLRHLGSLLHALDIAVMLHHYRRAGPDAAAVARRLLALAAEHDLEDYRAKAEIFLGWVEIDAGRAAEGLERLERGFATMQAIGTPEDFPVYQCMRAEALRQLGDPDAALAVLREGRSIIESEGVNYWGAELARHEAEAEMARERPDAEFVAARLAEAHEVAVAQGALMLELRARVSAVGWVRRQGPSRVAEGALAETLARFAPDTKGRDLDAARSVLAGGLAGVAAGVAGVSPAGASAETLVQGLAGGLSGGLSGGDT